MTKTSSSRVKGNGKEDVKFARSVTSEVLGLLGGLIFWWAGYNLLAFFQIENSIVIIWIFLIIGIVMILSPTIISHYNKEKNKKK